MLDQVLLDSAAECPALHAGIFAFGFVVFVNCGVCVLGTCVCAGYKLGFFFLR